MTGRVDGFAVHAFNQRVNMRQRALCLNAWTACRAITVQIAGV